MRRLTLSALIGIGGSMLAACTSVPAVDDSVGTAGAAPEVVGARGPLTERQAKAVLTKLGAAGQDTLARHLAVEQVVAETPLVAGNRTRVLHDGPSSFQAIFAAIRGARHHVNLEYYTLEDVASDGQSLSDLLLAKRREGVAINIIYDSFGSSETPAEFLDRLKQAGVQLLQFHPINPLEGGGLLYSLNDRDHRKILVADGKTAIVGGVNLSKSYESRTFALSSAPKSDETELPWRDTDLEIDGPAAKAVQQVFLDHWQRESGPPLDDAGFFPDIPAQGQEVLRIIGSTPENGVPRYYVTVLTAIRTAETRIWLTAAYFAPTEQEREDLEAAARRGVDVELLLPDASDSEMTINVQHSAYTELLEAGAKIFETHGEVLHSKTMAVDGVWSVIGSSNFDHRSVVFNDEIDAVCVGRDTAGNLEAGFRDAIGRARPITLAAWQERALGERLEEFFSRAWQNFL